MKTTMTIKKTFLLCLLFLAAGCGKEQPLPQNEYVVTIVQQRIDNSCSMLEQRVSIRIKGVRLVEQDPVSGRYVFQREKSQGVFSDFLVLTRNDQGDLEGDIKMTDYKVRYFFYPGQTSPIHFSNGKVTDDGVELRFEGTFSYHCEADKYTNGEPVEHKEYEMTGPFRIVSYY